MKLDVGRRVLRQRRHLAGARVQERQVESAQLLRRAPERGVHRRRIADVRRQRDAAQLGRGGLGRGGVEIEERHARALARQAPRVSM